MAKMKRNPGPAQQHPPIWVEISPGLWEWARGTSRSNPTTPSLTCPETPGETQALEVLRAHFQIDPGPGQDHELALKLARAYVFKYKAPNRTPWTPYEHMRLVGKVDVMRLQDGATIENACERLAEQEPYRSKGGTNSPATLMREYHKGKKDSYVIAVQDLLRQRCPGAWEGLTDLEIAVKLSTTPVGDSIDLDLL